MLTVGSLFAGIGGFDRGLERAGFVVKWQVENNLWCQQVLAKHWPHVPRYGDIRDIDWTSIEPVDLVCGGFPCQPFSVAGKRCGASDERNMWPEFRRCVEALRPAWVLGENVAGARTYIESTVRPELETMGYKVKLFGIPALAVGAWHLRKRTWIIAYTGHLSARKQINGSCGELINSATSWKQTAQGNRPSNGCQSFANKGWAADWSSEPAVGRVAHGVPHRVDRLRGLGNAVVPQVVEWLGRMILTVEAKHD